MGNERHAAAGREKKTHKRVRMCGGCEEAAEVGKSLFFSFCEVHAAEAHERAHLPFVVKVFV